MTDYIILKHAIFAFLAAQYENDDFSEVDFNNTYETLYNDICDAWNDINGDLTLKQYDNLMKMLKKITRTFD